MFVPGKPFQPNLLFVGKAKSLPYSGSSIGQAPAFPTLDLAGKACRSRLFRKFVTYGVSETI